MQIYVKCRVPPVISACLSYYHKEFTSFLNHNANEQKVRAAPVTPCLEPAVARRPAQVDGRKHIPRREICLHGGLLPETAPLHSYPLVVSGGFPAEQVKARSNLQNPLPPTKPQCITRLSSLRYPRSCSC